MLPDGNIRYNTFYLYNNGYWRQWRPVNEASLDSFWNHENEQSQTYLWGPSWVSPNTHEVVEADIDEEVVAIDDVESKDDRVLHLPEEW